MPCHGASVARNGDAAVVFRFLANRSWINCGGVEPGINGAVFLRCRAQCGLKRCSALICSARGTLAGPFHFGRCIFLISKCSPVRFCVAGGLLLRSFTISLRLPPLLNTGDYAPNKLPSELFRCKRTLRRWHFSPVSYAFLKSLSF